jgi:hypothetical protein
MGFMEELLNAQKKPDPEEIIRENLIPVMKTVVDGAHENNERLRALFGANYRVDEMALLFGTESSAMTFITALVEQKRYALFNSAKDEVRTAPILSVYNVRYWFVSTPWDFRLEIMVLGEGYSPVHEGLRQVAAAHDGYGVCAVHASFKVPDEEKYAACVHQFQKNGYAALQHCRSSYGQFSYFSQDATFDSDSRERWLLKPRLNTRDAS